MADEADPHSAAARRLGASTQKRAKTSWWSLQLIFWTSLSALAAVQFLGLGSSKPSWDFAAIVGLANLAFYVWIRMGSHWETRRQVGAVLTMLIAQALLYVMIRIDGFAGDGRLIFAWRWEHTPEQRWAQFATQTAQLRSPADLTRIGHDDSPAFRGADRTGQFVCSDLDTNWNEHAPRLLWRHPVGTGWSSFAVVGSYGVTQEQRGAYESVVCYDVVTGREVWEHGDLARFEEVTSGPGPRATPAIDNGRVYACGATGLVSCLNGANGAVVWQRSLADIAPDTSPPLFGYAGSPLVHASTVIVAGGAAGSLIAFSAHDGTLLWRSEPRPCGYSSPQLWQDASGDQVLLLDGVGVHGHDIETGNVLWSADWGDSSEEYVNVGQPVLFNSSTNRHEHDVLVSSGYGRGISSIRIGLGLDHQWWTQERWRSNSLESKFSCVVVRDQHAYGLDKGILTCVSLVDGKRRWKKGRYGYGQLIVINDLLLVQAEDGRVVLVRADQESATEVAVITALSHRTWNHPVVAACRLLVRNDREAACYALPKTDEDSGSKSLNR